MAKKFSLNNIPIDVNKKKTSQGRGNVKTSSMNKHKRRSYKKYRRQGKG